MKRVGLGNQRNTEEGGTGKPGATLKRVQFPGAARDLSPGVPPHGPRAQSHASTAGTCAGQKIPATGSHTIHSFDTRKCCTH